MYFYSHSCLEEVVVCVYVKMKVLVEPVIEQTQQLSSNMSLYAKVQHFELILSFANNVCQDKLNYSV